MQSTMEDIVFIDKPKGMTSFDVIRMLRRKRGVKKMGHAGTLDPNATGLLIIGVGAGTRRLEAYIGLPKTYIMDIMLGIRTDTGDVTGTTIEERAVASPDKEAVEGVLQSMIGTIDLPVPAYSALKYKGKPRYHYARRGIAIEGKTRGMEIFSLKLLGIETATERPVLKIEMNCASGTYARSVAEEIGRRLDTVATLRDLRRTRIGYFSVSDAKTLPI